MESNPIQLFFRQQLVGIVSRKLKKADYLMISLQVSQKLCWSIILLLTIPHTLVKAQIIPDGSLPTSVEQQRENSLNINGGERAGNNLFHSFKEFSVPEGIEAVFRNVPDIENIFTRITGESVSTINGILRSQGEANFFLLNPNGIIFGENAQLDVSGSFIATTAESIQFEDGVNFTTLEESETPILTVSVPIGLGFGSDPGSIVVQGTGHNISSDPQTLELIKSNRPVGLQVPSGKTLGLVGGNISLEGGNLTTEGGRIELGSVGGGETVKLIPDNSAWKLNYREVEQFQDINFSQASSADASGSGGGSIQLQSGQANIVDGSIILSETLGNSSGKDLIVKASESIELVDGGSIFSTTKADGQGGDIVIETRDLRVTNAPSFIANTTFGGGNSGNLSIIAENIEIIGTGSAEFGFLAGIASTVQIGAMGNGGDVTIEADRLRVSNLGQIQASTAGSGNAGNLHVTASDIEVTGGNSLGGSGLGATTFPGATGNGGDVTIAADRLRVSNLGQIQASTAGSGNAGNLEITASDIEVTGGNELGVSSLNTVAFPEATGNGGNLTIETDRLLVTNGAQLATATIGFGDGGNLIVKAGQIELIGSSFSFNSGFFASAIIGNGNGGDIDVDADSLTINDGATISAGNFSNLASPGMGSPGNINIRAENIRLSEGSITANTLMGDRGNIVLDANQIQLRDGSEITTNAESTDGGNINIGTDSLTVLDRSLISGNTSVGQGGNIQITTEGLFRSANSTIEASSELGIDGTVQINTPDINLQNELEQSELELLTAENAIANSCLARSNRQGSFTIGNSGLPKNPDSNYSDLDFSLTGVGSLPVITEKFAPNQGNNWQQHSVMIPAEKMVTTEDGRIFLVAAPQKTESLFCSSLFFLK